MPAKKSNRPLPPLRVRREPPTVDEAVIAAQALTDDIEQQVVVAAGLIGLPEDEVRPHVLNAPPPPRHGRRRAQSGRFAGADPRSRQRSGAHPFRLSSRSLRLKASRRSTCSLG